MHRILLTGAGGFIGGQTASVLHQAGFDLTAIYRSPQSRKLPWRTLVVDLATSEAGRALNEVTVDIVIHCAAILPASFDSDGSFAEREN